MTGPAEQAMRQARSDAADRQEAVAAGFKVLDATAVTCSGHSRHVPMAQAIDGLNATVARYADLRDARAREGLSDPLRLKGIVEAQQFGACDCGQDEFLVAELTAALDANASLRAALHKIAYEPIGMPEANASNDLG